MFAKSKSFQNTNKQKLRKGTDKFKMPSLVVGGNTIKEMVKDNGNRTK